jgi:hypothetical protein
MALLISSRILFYLLLLFTIIHTINSYRLRDLESVLENKRNEQFEIQNERQDEPNHIQLRSVLWPKICIRKLQGPHHHRYQRDENNNYIRRRQTRKCYPFNR